jgi:hypothetical protein
VLLRLKHGELYGICENDLDGVADSFDTFSPLNIDSRSGRPFFDTVFEDVREC